MTTDYKTPSESLVVTRQIVMPQHANPLQTLFGGVLVSWIDEVGSMVATKYSRALSVTASIDLIDFKSPIHVGDHLILEGIVTYVGRTSMEIRVRVDVENPFTGESWQATSAFLTFVAINKDGKPIPVPRLKPETIKEKQCYENAKLRKEAHKEMRARLHHD